jgi:hypothetical protein
MADGKSTFTATLVTDSDGAIRRLRRALKTLLRRDGLRCTSILMNKLMERYDNNIPVDSDGWNEAAAEGGERVIKGALIKFADGRWTLGRASLQEGALQLVAVGTSTVWARWAGGKPDKYVMKLPGQHFPERYELGDTDENRWEMGPNGEPRDPWQLTRLMYLMDPTTAEAFTFSATSQGGKGAVADLAEAITRYRFARPGASPVVELRTAPMPTKYGMKSKPHFKIVSWVGGDAPSVEPKLVSERVLDDEIPF